MHVCVASSQHQKTCGSCGEASHHVESKKTATCLCGGPKRAADYEPIRGTSVAGARVVRDGDRGACPLADVGCSKAETNERGRAARPLQTGSQRIDVIIACHIKSQAATHGQARHRQNASNFVRPRHVAVTDRGGRDWVACKQASSAIASCVFAKRRAGGVSVECCGLSAALRYTGASAFEPVAAASGQAGVCRNLVRRAGAGAIICRIIEPHGYA